MIVDDVQITEFVAPEETVVIPMNNPSRVADSVIRQSIQDFISRPYRIDSVQWKTTDVIGSSLTFILPLESVLSRATVWNKLANFKYFRCG
ncbi:MAG: hypothetical protein NWF07_16205, partial [Candidatus Bathyarchaeota archaeon]|nr:hypothetical protein [Candidatus Bathyarchaeota archaeon]